MATVLYPAPVFGPVQSRRLGRSLGINLLPSDGKLCSFDCIYCECGLNADFRPKLRMTPREEVRGALASRLQAMHEAGEPLDALTFSGNGEPTSHPDFEGIVEDVCSLRDRWYPQARVCLLTNATHVGDPAVARSLARIDRPCLKLDTVDPDYIRLVDRPQTPYDVRKQIALFARMSGRCIVQTMFLRGSWEGRDVDNTGEEYVGPWLAALAEIRPAGVDIYTVARGTPGEGLRKVPLADLEAIAQRVRTLGIDAHAYG